ncbi:MAG: hypothetical protein MZU95_01760 [Desulfomicrobium escambiense]|nr:hypothetical protein [Desulfomicrobium escambiense]
MKELWKRYKTVDKFDASYWEGVVIGMIMERAFIRAYEKSKNYQSGNDQCRLGIIQK